MLQVSAQFGQSLRHARAGQHKDMLVSHMSAMLARVLGSAELTCEVCHLTCIQNGEQYTCSRPPSRPPASRSC